MKIDKQNGNVAFAEAEHCYWDVTNDNKFISVTTLIEKFAQKFDKEFWSKYKALEKLLPPDAWKMEKKNSPSICWRLPVMLSTSLVVRLMISPRGTRSK